MKKIELVHSLRDLCSIIKQTNISYNGSHRRKQEGEGRKKNGPNFPNVMKTMNLYIYEVIYSELSHRINPKRFTPRAYIIKLQRQRQDLENSERSDLSHVRNPQ
jgi:hypothetical protein